MKPINTFFAPIWGFFTFSQEKSDEIPFPENSKYVIENSGEYIRMYCKNGTVTTWDGQENGFVQFVQKAIKDGLYREIEFPNDFSSANLLVQPEIIKDDTTNCNFTYQWP